MWIPQVMLEEKNMKTGVEQPQTQIPLLYRVISTLWSALSTPVSSVE